MLQSPHTRPESSQHLAERSTSLGTFSLGAIFLLVVADWGLFSPYDAGVVAGIMAIARPAWAPGLLALCSLILDARGMNTVSSYATNAFLAVVTFIGSWVGIIKTDPLSGRQKWLFRLALAVVAYGLALSTTYALFGGPTQSEDRPFYLVGPLAALMILGGTTLAKAASSSPYRARQLALAILLGSLNMFLVCILQAVISPEFCHSEAGALEISTSWQLAEASLFGLPRLTGTTLSPNAMALIWCMSAVILLSLNKTRLENYTTIVGFVLIGFVAFAFSQSRSALTFFMISIGLLLINQGGILFFLYMPLASVTAYLLLWRAIRLDSIADILRLGGEVLGNRGLAWQAQIDRFTLSDWLFGRGLSNWKIFFFSEIGVPLQDPHSYLLSVPGTYGLMGVIFYIVLGLILAKAAAELKQSRLLILMVICIVFIVDAFEVLITLGNTPLTILLWFAMMNVIEKSESSLPLLASNQNNPPLMPSRVDEGVPPALF